ncbi:MAG: hypothetical protein ACE5GE_10585 [Phycisphaerae bacterium]
MSTRSKAAMAVILCAITAFGTGLSLGSSASENDPPTDVVGFTAFAAMKELRFYRLMADGRIETTSKSDGYKWRTTDGAENN